MCAVKPTNLYRVASEREALPNILESLRPSRFHIINDDSGFWAVITK